MVWQELWATGEQTPSLKRVLLSSNWLLPSRDTGPVWPDILFSKRNPKSVVLMKFPIFKKLYRPKKLSFSWIYSIHVSFLELCWNVTQLHSISLSSAGTGSFWSCKSPGRITQKNYHYSVGRVTEKLVLIEKDIGRNWATSMVSTHWTTLELCMAFWCWWDLYHQWRATFHSF